MAASRVDSSWPAVPAMAFLISATGVLGSKDSSPDVAVLIKTVPAIDREMVGPMSCPRAMKPFCQRGHFVSSLEKTAKRI